MNSPRSLRARRSRRIPLLQNLSFAVLAVGALLPSPALRAATDTFVGNGANPLFSTGFNPTPQNGDTLLFGAPGNGGTTVTDDIASLSVGGVNTDGIDFSTAAPGYTIGASGGAVLTLGSSGTGIAINDLSLYAQTITVPLALSSAQTFNVGSANGSLTVGTVSGAFTLTKTGAGLLSLNSTSTFGNLVVLGGTVQAGGDNNIGAANGSITLDGGTLRTNFGNNNFTFNIGSGRTILLGDAGAGTGGTIDTSGGNSTFGGVIANNGGTNSFTETGGGGLTLTGANTYTGTTFVNLGQLSLDYNAAADNGSATFTPIINAASNLVLGGNSTVLGAVADVAPSFFVQGANGGARTQTFNGLTLRRGGDQIAARGVQANNMTLAFGAITRNAGATVAFSNLSGGSTGTGVFTTTNTNDASGILGGWAVINAAAANSTNFQVPTDYATVNGSGQIVPYAGYAAVASGATLSGTTVANNRVTAAGGVALAVGAGTTDINTLSLASTATGATTVTIDASGILRTGANGGFFTASGSGSITLTGGTLTAGGAANAAGEISLIGGGNGSPFTVNSVIADNGSGAVALTISQYNSGGNITLNGANTYSGGTYLNSGRALANNNAAFGTGTVTISSHAQAYLNYSGVMANAFNISGASNGNNDTPSAIRFQGGQTLSGTITLRGDATIGIRNSTGNVISGQITGNYNLTLGEGAAAGGSITLSNPANNFGGNLTINQDRLILGASNVLPDGTAAGNVVLSNNGSSILDLNGFSETINGLTSNGAAGVGGVQNTGMGASVLSLGGNNQSFAFNGFIRDSGAGKTLGIDKIGAGTMTLGNTATATATISNYSGGTQIDAGTLRLAAGAPSSALGTGGVTVNTGGTFDLNGNSPAIGALGGTGGLVTSSATGSLTLTTGDATNTVFAGTIQNGNATSLGLTKQGGGTIDLTGANTYTGATNVTAGALQIGFGGSLPASSAVNVSGTGSLILGDGNGAANATFNNLTTASTASVVGGATGQFSTVTLNNAGSVPYANTFGGTGANQNNLNLVIAGTGTAPTSILTGLNTYTGFTTVNNGSTLSLAGGSISGSTVTVNSGGTLTGSGNNSTTGVVGGIVASGGSALTLAGTSGTALRSTGAITLGGAGTYGAGVYTTLNYTLAGAGAVESLNTPVVLTLNSGGVFVNITNPTTTGTYTLANFGSRAGAGAFSLSSTTAGVTTLSVGRNTETLAVNATSLVLTITGTPTPGVAFFNGAVSSVFNDTTTSTTLVNFSTNQAGTTDAGNIPGAATDVVLVANNATNSTHRNTTNIVTTLGASTTINSLNALSAAPSGLTRFTINADGSTLTINGNADNNTATGGGFTGNTAGNAIRLAAGAAPLTINTPVVLGAGNNLTFTNSSSNALTLGGTVTASAASGNTQILTLTNAGTGGTALNGVIANSATGALALVVSNSGTGVTTLGTTNTYSGGTTLNAGTLTGTASGAFGTGNVTVDANDNNFDDATLNTNGSIASTAAVIVNSTTGTATVNFNGTTPAIGSLAGNGNVVLNNPGGTTLTVGNAANNLSSNFSGPISGTGGLVTAGTGTVVLSGTNTYNASTTVSSGILQLGSAAALPANTLNGGANLVINTGGTLDLNSNSTSLAAIPTGTGGTITDSSGTTSTLTLAGGGTLAQALTGNLALAVPSGNLVLNATNTYSGGTTISGAGTTVTANTSTSLGANVAGSNVVIGAGAVLNLQSTVSDFIYSNTFSGGGLLKITNSAGANGGTTLPNFNAFSGTIEVATTANSNKVLVRPDVLTNLSSATLLIDNGSQYFNTNNVNFGTINVQGVGNTEGRGAIRLNGNGTTMGILGGNVFLQGNTTIGSEGGTLPGNISAGIAGTQTLTMGTGASQGTALLSGNLTDGSGQLALTQAFGTTTLTGTASTYTGGTTISGGTLLVNGNTSAATGVVAVTGILGGTGSVGGPTTVNAGGRITGGTIGGISTLTLANTLTINGTYLVDIANGVNMSDRLTLGGTGTNGLLTLATGSTLTLSTTALDGTSTYILASYASLSGTFSTTNVPTGYTLVYGGRELDLVPGTAVPEPSALAAAFLGLGALGLSFRRRTSTAGPEREFN